MFGKCVAIGKRCIFFLNMAAVWQQNFAQITCTPAGMHMTRKPFFHQQGQVAAVIQMGMGQQYGINLIGCYGQRSPIAKPQLLVALKQTAVHQHMFAVVLNQVFGTGDGTCAA